MSLIANRMLRYLPEGPGPWVTKEHFLGPQNCTAAQFTHGPGTGVGTAGTSEILAPEAGELPGGCNFGRVTWTSPPRNAEERQPYPSYFSNCFHFGLGGYQLSGTTVEEVLMLRTSSSVPVRIIPFFECGNLTDPYDGSGFQFGMPIVIPPGSKFTKFTQLYSVPPARLKLLREDLAGNGRDIWSVGCGIETTEFAWHTMPFYIDYWVDCVPYEVLYTPPTPPPEPITGTPNMSDVELELLQSATHIRRMGRGATGFAISTTAIRLGLQFGIPFVAGPGCYVRGAAGVWHAATQTSKVAQSPIIIAANEVTANGAVLDIDGWEGLTPGSPVICETEFLVLDAG